MADSGDKKPRQVTGLVAMLSLLVKRIFSLFLSLYRSNFGFRTGFAFDEFAAVVGIQQDLFQFGDQRVARVSAGALVIECIFRQFINVGRKSAS